MENKFICQYCGKDTSEVEYDYLSGYDHLGCALKNEMNSDSQQRSRTLFTVSEELVYSTPNDQELGKKVRQLYWDSKNI